MVSPTTLCMQDNRERLKYVANLEDLVNFKVKTVSKKELT